jgi:prepilin-type N-terminal cleavage/methylation domain-containing protein
MLKRYYEIQARRAKDPESGFTLIELLIVIVVLGILAAVVVFALGGVTSKSAVSACNADAKTVETAYAAYQAQGGATVSVTAQANPLAAQQAIDTAVRSALVPAYLHSWPSSSHYSLYAGTTTPSGAAGAVTASSNGDVLILGTGPNSAESALAVSYDGQSSSTGCNAVS